MSLRLVAPAILAAFAALPLHADPVDPLNELLDRIGLAEIVRIMRAEGLAYGEDMAADLLPGGANAAWEQAVSTIYDTEAMSRDGAGRIRRELRLCRSRRRFWRISAARTGKASLRWNWRPGAR